MKNHLTLFALFFASFLFSQTKNFIDQPYIETSAEADTLVVPDRIYLKITISENDTKNKKSVEELENLMVQKLKDLKIDVDKQLFVNSLMSNYKPYLLKSADVMKTKSYQLLVYDGITASRVILDLEKIDIANVHLLKTEHSQEEKILSDLKKQAILKAKKNAENIVNAIGQKVGKAILISDMDYTQALSGQVAGLAMRGRGVSSLESKNYEPVDLDFTKIAFSGKISVTFKLEQ